MDDASADGPVPASGFPCRTELLFSYRAGLQAPPEVIGPVPEGVRVNFYITGGEITGPRLRGQLRAVGADNFLIRHDGVGELDVRTTFETHDGALIDVSYRGLGDLGADGHAAFLRGELPPRLPLRILPRLRTAHPDYQWLERLVCVGIGEADLVNFVVRYDIYAVR
jgi:hypothetical protein